MKKFSIAVITIFASALPAAGCETSPSYTTTTTPSPTVTPSPTPTPVADNSMPVTLPLIDAFFYADEDFASSLKNNLQLTDEQVERLRTTAREETARLRESYGDDQSEHGGSTVAAGELSERRIAEIVGEEKARQLSDFVLRRWRNGGDVAATAVPVPTAAPASSPMMTGSPNVPGSPTPGVMRPAVTAPGLAPADTRVLINIPAYRMDAFENGRLVKSYKIGIGYPEFPLPTGMRNATSIIFNPTWTPPDEPWVESPSSKVKVGEKVPAGSKLNPLGVVKIPIGLPSLIHGGKNPARLGQFASHGCVGLTDAQIKDFARVLAELSGGELTDAEIAQNLKTPAKTENVKLDSPLPVELRYETIVVQDGKLRIYRDVYERGTNTEENLRNVLASHGVTVEQLSQDELRQARQALEEMSRGPSGKPVEATSPEEKEQQKQRNIERGRLTRTIKGQKEAVVEIAALAGKGYPAPVEDPNSNPTQAEKATPPQRRRR